jgi:putative ABC transport system permease protein
MSAWRLAWTLARRDLRGGWRGLPVLLACLGLGVAAIAGIGSLSESVRGALRADARQLLGGDIDIRRTHQPMSAEARDWVAARAGAMSDTVRMRAMVSGGDGRALVELKAVDGAYPLLGAMTLSPPLPLAEALVDGGAVAEAALLARLGVAVGDSLRLGEREVVLRAVIIREPDRLASVFSLGPRLMVASDTLPATGLVQTGSLIRYHVKALLAGGRDAKATLEALDDAYPETAWRLRDASAAQPGLRRFVERLGMYLGLVGLTALLVGGIGVASAVASHLQTRVETVATLKSLGATPSLVMGVYALQVALVVAAGIAIGLILGAAAPFAVAPLAGQNLALSLHPGLAPLPLSLAALFGALVALVVTLWPLATVSAQPAARLYRPLAETVRPPRRYVLLVALAGLALIVVTAGTAPAHGIGWWFVAAALFATLLLLQAARLTAWAARLAAPRLGGITKLALLAIAAPAGPTRLMVLALGMGLSVLVAIGAVEDSFRAEIAGRLAEESPAFFFIDIQRDQADALSATVAAVPGAEPPILAPMLRGRITALNGTPAGELDMPPGSRWLVRNDLGMTFRDTPQPGVPLAAGDWWGANYAGPPLVSLSAGSAMAAGFAVGDTVAFTVLGRRIEAEIANFRNVDWSAVTLNFVVIFSPGVFDGAPYAYIATAQAARHAEDAVVRAIGKDFPNVSAVAVREVLETAKGVLSAVGGTLRATAGLTLLAGILVLAGVVAAGRRARIRDAAILKVLGARRGDLLRAHLLEFALIGCAAGLVAVAVGGITAWAFVSQIMAMEWAFSAWRALATVLGGTAITAAVGFAGTWQALAQKAAPLLRGS